MQFDGLWELGPVGMGKVVLHVQEIKWAEMGQIQLSKAVPETSVPLTGLRWLHPVPLLAGLTIPGESKVWGAGL